MKPSPQRTGHMRISLLNTSTPEVGGCSKNVTVTVDDNFHFFSFHCSTPAFLIDNAADLCLENIQASLSNNPYNAPAGSIVVVRAGTPGTANPVAGDIAVCDPPNFWNGGAMGKDIALSIP